MAGTNSYSYDAAERLETLTGAAVFDFTYDMYNGLLASMACSNIGLSAQRQYDDLDRLTNLVWQTASNAVLRSFSYQYNAVGLITNVTDEDGTCSMYTFDDLDQLTGERRSQEGEVMYDVNYSYDAAGNRTSKTQTGLTVSYAYANGCSRLVGWTASSTNDFAAIREVNAWGGASEEQAAVCGWEDHGVVPQHIRGGRTPGKLMGSFVRCVPIAM